MRGRDKLLELVDGAPLLRMLASRALATGLPVWVVLPPARTARQAALEGFM
ncbi:MAG: nucleotidyltransferase family protein, partial [Pseudomonadota bacterium]